METVKRVESDPADYRRWQRPLAPEKDLVLLGPLGRPRISRSSRERRHHARTSPPALSNGSTYTLRAVAVAAPLAASDLVALLASILSAATVAGRFLPLDPSGIAGLFLALSAGLVGIRGAMGLYPAIGVPPRTEARKSGLSTLFLFGAFFLAGLVWGAGAAAQWVLVIGGVAHLVVTPVLRSFTRKLMSRFRWWSQPLLIFGDGPAAQRLSAFYTKRPELGLIPVLVPNEALEDESTPGSAVRALSSQHRAVCAAIPWDATAGDPPAGLLRESFNTFPHLLIVPDTSHALGAWKEVTDLGGVAGIRAGKGLLFPMPRAVKRISDSTLALMLVLLCLPLFVMIAITVKLTSRGPIFYGHERIGRDRKRFRAWKFRSMRMNAAELLQQHFIDHPEAREEWAKDQKLRDDPRLTPVGRLLRRTSLDELPQLWNVIRGDMSLVGPRPIVENEVGKYGTEFERYMSVPPGITGLWQVSGRNNTTYEERIRLDALYVENWSLTLDAYILGKTVGVVFTGDGAY